MTLLRTWSLMQHCDQRKYAPRKPETKCPSVYVSEVTARPCRGGRGLTPRCDTREEMVPQPTNKRVPCPEEIKEYTALGFNLSVFRNTRESSMKPRSTGERSDPSVAGFLQPPLPGDAFRLIAFFTLEGGLQSCCSQPLLTWSSQPPKTIHDRHSSPRRSN